MVTKKRGSDRKPAPTKGVERRKSKRTISLKDTLDLWVDHNVLLDERIIYLGSIGTNSEDEETGVDAAMARKFELGMTILEARNPKAPIKIILSSYGGDIVHGMSIYGRIKRSPCQVNIEGTGPIMSAGIMIGQSGYSFMLDRRARVLVHYPEHTIFFRHQEDALIQIRDCLEYNDEMEKILLSRIQKKRPDFKLEQLREKMRFDWPMSATEAVSWGLAEGILRSSGAQTPPSSKKG